MDNEGKNALQIALYKSDFSSIYAGNELDSIYRHIITDSIKVKVEDRLIKIDNHKIEYFLLNYMIALQTVLIKNKKREVGVKMADFYRLFRTIRNPYFPITENNVPNLNQAIARNEVDAKEEISKKLFFRVARTGDIDKGRLDE